MNDRRIDVRLLDGSAAIDRMRNEVTTLISILRFGLKQCGFGETDVIVMCEKQDIQWKVGRSTYDCGNFTCTLGDHSERSEARYANWPNRSDLGALRSSMTKRVRESMPQLIEELFKRVPGLEESVKIFLEAAE